MLTLRKSSAAVLVAAVLSFSLILGVGTRDAAQAFVVPPPVVAVVGETLGAPASALLFTPGGFAIAAGAALAWLAWDNRDTLAQWADNISCFVSGCDVDGTRPIDYQSQQPIGPHTQSQVTFQLTAGASGSFVRTKVIGCTLTPPYAKIYEGDATVNPCAKKSMPTLSWKADCQDNTTGAYRVEQTPSGGGWSRSDSVTGRMSPWNWDGSPDTRVCKDSETARRVWWWNSGSDSPFWTFPGEWTNGAVPYETQIDATCSLDANPDPLNNITVVGEVTTGLAHDGSVKPPKCPPGYSWVSDEVKTRVLGDNKWMNGPQVRASDLAPTKYPQCVTVGGASKGCATAVFIDDVECTTGRAPCWDWQRTASRGLQTVECRWGPYSMPLSDCDPLAQAYRTGNYANTGGTGTWYASDPNGNPVNTPDPDPDGGGSTQPSNPTVPKPSDPTTEPGNGDDPNTSSGADPDGDENCWKSAISWNPVDWVVTPVKCVLLWAFVPPDGYPQEVLNSVKDGWSQTAVGQWVGSVGKVAGKIKDTGSNCAGPALTIRDGSILPSTTLHPFSACSQPQATVAAVLRTGLGAVAYIGTFLACVGMLAGSMGYRAPITEPESVKV